MRSAARRALPGVAALLLFLAYGTAVLWPALVGDQVLSAGASLVRYGPFPAELRERAPAGLDCLSDSVHCFVPWLRFAADAFAADGRLPLWKPTAACGAPFVGNGQSAVFFPPNLLALLLGAPPAMHALVALFKLVAGAFCAWLLARHLRLSFVASLLCGLCFGFGGFQMGLYLHPLTNVSLLLPLLLLATDRLVLRPSLGRAGLLAVVAGLQGFGGHPETIFHCQLTALVLAGVRAYSLRDEISRAAAGRRVAWVIGALVLGAALAAVQLAPLVEYLTQSAALHARREDVVTPAQEHPLAAAGFGLALVVALLALRRLARCERGPGLACSALALFGATAAGIFAGLHAGLEPSFVLQLAPDWFGDPQHYLGPAVYIGESAAFLGAALPLAALGLLQGRPRGIVLVAGAIATVGLLEANTAPLVDDLLRRLPIFRLVLNARMGLLALLALAVLAGYGLDALVAVAARSWSRGRVALALLAPALGAIVGLGCAVHVGTITSRNSPALLKGLDVVEARLWPAAQVEPLFRDDARRAPAEPSKVFYGGVVPRTPHDGIQLVYGRASEPAETSWKAVPAMKERPRWAEEGVEVFRATVPLRKLPREQTRVRVQLMQGDRVVASSELLAYPDDDGGTWWPFPARPAPGRAAQQLLLLAVALGLVTLVPHSGAARTGLRVALPVLVAASLWSFDSGLVASLPRDLFYPPSPALEALKSAGPEGRMLSLRADALGAEIPTYYGIADVGGYDAIGPARSTQLYDAALRRSAAAGPDFALLGLMSVRDVVDLDPLPPKFTRLPWAGERDRRGAAPFTIAENPFFLPRARLVGSSVVEPDDERALALLQDTSFPRERSVVLAAGGPRATPHGATEAAGAADAAGAAGAAGAGSAGAAGSARIVSDRPDRLQVQIEPAAPGWLVLSDTYFPGWVATVDGQPREIARANVAFRAVEVRPGERLVEFRYEPLSYRGGALVSLLAAAVLVVLAACGLLSLRRSARDAAARGRQRA